MKTMLPYCTDRSLTQKLIVSLSLICLISFSIHARPDGIHISELLDDAGYLVTDSGLTGNVDMAGYEMVFDECGAPLFVSSASMACDMWSSFKGLPQGVNRNTVYASVIDANTGSIYIGGDFTVAGAASAARVARWDGSSWSALGDGFNNTVYTLALDNNGGLYAGGSFTASGTNNIPYIARWNGFSWQPIPTLSLGAPNGTIYDIAVDNNNGIYAGGDFVFNAGLSTVNNISYYNPMFGSWTALGSAAANGTTGQVNAIEISPSGRVYVGGQFQAAGGVMVNSIAVYSPGGGWSALGNLLGVGVSGVVYDISITPFGFSGTNAVFVGGEFTNTASGVANNIAFWDEANQNWNSLPGVGGSVGVAGQVNAVSAFYNGNLTVYAGGFFNTAGSVSTNNIASWNGSNWSAVGMVTMDGADNGVHTISQRNGTMVAGGQYDVVDGVVASRVALWDGNEWYPMTDISGGRGLNDLVRDIAVNAAGELYAVGAFEQAGGILVNYVAMWDGISWNALGTGTNGGLNYAVDIDQAGHVYVGGNFTQAGGVPALRIAKWDGSSWTAMGTGFNNAVRDIHVDSQDDIYVTGGFTNAGLSRIARWDGSSWQPLGSGLGSPSGFAVHSDGAGRVYAGGSFTTAGGAAANNIAVWNGTSWGPMGSGMNSYVNTIQESPAGDIYVGGAFTSAGGSQARRIAIWDGAAWSTLGVGFNNEVHDIAFDADGLPYAVGAYTLSGSTVLNRAARWDGSSWIQLGTSVTVGLNDVTYAIEYDPSASKMYVGGLFTEVEADLSAHIACYEVCATNLCSPDVTPPTALCMNATVSLNSAGMASITAADIDAGSSDLCGPVDLTIDIMSFSCTDVGTPVTVTLTVKDLAGNPSTCTGAVTVNDPQLACANGCNPDMTPPMAVCMDIVFALDAAGMASLLPADIDGGSSDNCAIAGMTVDISSFDCMNIGQNDVTLTVKDAVGLSDQCTATVTVVDVTAPVAECVSSLVVQIMGGIGGGFVTISPQQVDNGSIDNCAIVSYVLSDDTFTCADVGQINVVTLAVEDAGGLTGTCMTQVIVQDPNMVCNNNCTFDMTPPVAVCFTNIEVDLDQNGMFTLSVSDIDNGSFDLCGPIQMGIDPMVLTCADVGGVIVQLKVVDAATNSSSCTTQVEVNDPFGACCPAVLYVDDDPIPSGLYKATDNVYSDKTVPASNVVDFRAGQQVNLLPGFETISGATFHAYISPCN